MLSQNSNKNSILNQFSFIWFTLQPIGELSHEKILYTYAKSDGDHEHSKTAADQRLCLDRFIQILPVLNYRPNSIPLWWYFLVMILSDKEAYEDEFSVVRLVETAVFSYAFCV